MIIRYSRRAAAELDGVLNSIGEQSPQGAAKVKARLLALIAALPEQPRMGRLTRKPNVRRVVATPYPYLIFYRATASEIIIDSVRHAARRPRSDW